MNRAKIVALLQRANGWKLWSSVILVTLLIVEVIVATLDLLFYGHIMLDDMIKGFVATAIVEPTHLVFMVFMLGEFAQAERRSIQLSEQYANSRLNIAIEHSQMIIWEMDFVTNALRYDDDMLRLFGMPEGTVARDLSAWLALVHEQDRARFVALYHKILTSSEGVFDYEYRLLHPQGQLCWVHTRGKVIARDANGQPVLAVGSTVNTTARKQMELALAESNQLLNAVIATAPVRIFWKDKDLRYLGCNPAFAHDAGLDEPQELIGKDDYQMGWYDQAEAYRADDRKVMDSGVSKINFDEPQTTPDGSTIWLRTSKVPLRDEQGRTIGIFGLYEDVTERKRDEEALVASERKLNAVLDNVDAYIYLKDTQGHYLFANRPVLALWQVGLDEVVGCDDSKFFDAATVENIRRNDARVLRDAETVRIEETNTVPATGVTSTYLSTKIPLRREDGSVYALCGISTDISARKKIENSLLESEKRLHLALDAAHMGVWEYNFSTGILYWSPEIHAHLHTDNVGHLQDYLLSIVHPDDKVIYQDAMRRAIAEHRPYMAVYRIIVNGILYWSEDRGDLIYDEQGRPLKIIGTAQDITERKLTSQALEESEAALRESQMIAGLGSYVLDLRTGMWRSSALLDHLLGIDEHYVHTVAGWEALIHPEDLQMMHDYFLQEVIGNRQLFDKEYRIVRRTDNALRWVAGLGRLEFDADGAPTKMHGTIQDITERKLAEEAFKQLNIELEQRVQERTAQLRYANSAKDSFLATMSHEIRTPLGGLLGMLELLSLTKLDSDQRDTLQVAGQSGESLLRIVDDILDWSKIEAGKLQLAPRPSSLVQLLHGVVNTYSQLANAKNIMLHQYVDPQLDGTYLFDALRVSQVLNNFTSNAIKFTAQGTVRVTADLLQRHNGQVTVCLSVIDSGAGIDPQHQERLFQHYEQASADTARMYGGTGLGLSICRRLADLMDGSIKVESAPGQGSTFSLTLTLEVVSAQAAVKHELASVLGRTTPQVLAALPGAGQSVKLLIVDDHPVNRLLLKQQLGLLGLQVEAAADGVQALALWREGNFDLVITDCHMPEMDGYTLTAHIRASESGSRHVPIIAWTANVLDEEAEHCRRAGMDDILTKPTDLNELRQKLAHWLPQGKMADSGLNKSAPQSEALAVLDMKVIEQFSREPAQQAELLREFDKQNRIDLAQLHTALQQHDAGAASSAAHRIKGASRMMGALQMEQVCCAIEIAAAREDVAEVRRLVTADLAEAALQLQGVIQRHDLL